jgi:hypothetical protein
LALPGARRCNINGGGTPSRDDAERECLAEVAFALEGNPDEYDSYTQAVSLEVLVVPAA